MAKKYYLGEGAARELDKALPYINQQMRTTKFSKRTRTPLFGGKAFLAKITSEGPNGEDDFNDPRYWIREVINTNSDNDHTSVLTFDYPEKPEDLDMEDWRQVTHWNVAVNMDEIDLGTHLISTNDDVFVFVSIKADQNNLVRYYFTKQIKLWVKITGTSVITTNRWLYTFEQVKLDTGGKFTTVDSGITGNAYNTIEVNNAITGLLGSGDDEDEFPDNITEYPLGIGAVVEMKIILNIEGNKEYLFTAPNNAGGNCP